MKGKILSKLQYVLWSYDIKKLDLVKDKNTIITQILNYGDWDDVKWLLKVYTEKDIIEVVKHPRRGVWFEKVLSFWLTMFKIDLPYNIKELAIMKICPK